MKQSPATLFPAGIPGAGFRPDALCHRTRLLQTSRRFVAIVAALALVATQPAASAAAPAKPPLVGKMARLPYNQPGLVVDLGVGLWGWPLPLDYNQDGRMDLIVVCTGLPTGGTWYFENSGQIHPGTALPIFKPGVLLGKSAPSPAISHATGRPIVTSTGAVYPDFERTLFQHPVKIPAPARVHAAPGFIRQDQWNLVDLDGDGALDLTVGVDYWGDHGPAYGGTRVFEGTSFDAQGSWRRGPLHGYVYFLRNTGTTQAPVYAAPQHLMAGGQPVDPYGMPSPTWADFDGDGDLDLICGEFLDGFTYYENIGTRTAPRFAAGRPLTIGGRPIKMDLCMIAPTAVDFDGDGDVDLVVAEEDGRVALLENLGRVIDGMPQFLPPRHFQQFAEDVKFGALSTPYAFDWDGDGDDDLIVGNSAGYIGWIENLGGEPTRWAPPRYLSAGGKVIRELAGPNGSVHGPGEAKWGYSILSVADWDGDGLPDIITNGIWGKVVWYRNIGTRTAPQLAPAQPIEVAPGTTSPKPAWLWWSPPGREFVTQWRTVPQVIDWNGDGLQDLVMLDHEGYLALFERKRGADGKLELSPGQRVFYMPKGPSSFDANNKPMNTGPGLLRLNERPGGPSGRRTFCIVDWDGDGILDLMVNSVNVTWFRGLGRDTAGRWTYEDKGPMSTQALAAHQTKPAVFDWNKDGVPDLLIGAEDGFFYLLPNPRGKK